MANGMRNHHNRADSPHDAQIKDEQKYVLRLADSIPH